MKSYSCMGDSVKFIWFIWMDENLFILKKKLECNSWKIILSSQLGAPVDKLVWVFHPSQLFLQKAHAFHLSWDRQKDRLHVGQISSSAVIYWSMHFFFEVFFVCFMGDFLPGRWDAGGNTSPGTRTGRAGATGSGTLQSPVSKNQGIRKVQNSPV